MPGSKSKTKETPFPSLPTRAKAIPNGEVLNLSETAAYLRIAEAEVLRLIRDQGLPGRKLGEEWRFLKSAVQEWLRAPPTKKEGLLMQIGAFQDDPHLEEMLEEIHRRRGRPSAQGR